MSQLIGSVKKKEEGCVGRGENRKFFSNDR